MDDTLDFTFERYPKGSLTVGVAANVCGRLVCAGAINPYRGETIQRFIKELLDQGLEIDPELLLDDLRAKALDCLRPPSDGLPAKAPAERDHLAEMPQAAISAAVGMLDDPGICATIVADLHAMGVAGEERLALLIYLCATSRLLDSPCSAVVRGPSAGGKSYVLKKVAAMFPPETKVETHSLSPQALNYLPRDYLRHRVVFAGEQTRVETDAEQIVKRSLRELLSDGRLVRLVAEPDPEGGVTTREYIVEGPIAFLDTTTKAELFEEDANRVIHCYVDESTAQTREVIRAASQAFTCPTLGKRFVDTERGCEDLHPLVAKHWAFHRILQREACEIPVAIPFASTIGDMMPTDQLSARRSFPLAMGLVRAVAMIHFRQRKRDADGRLLAELVDYAIARELLAQWIEEALGSGLQATWREVLDCIREHFPGQEFTAKDVADKLRDRLSLSAVRYRIECLASHEFLVAHAPHQRPRRYRLPPRAGLDTGSGLPSADEVAARMNEREACGGTC